MLTATSPLFLSLSSRRLPFAPFSGSGVRSRGATRYDAMRCDARCRRKGASIRRVPRRRPSFLEIARVVIDSPRYDSRLSENTRRHPYPTKISRARDKEKKKRERKKEKEILTSFHFLSCVCRLLSIVNRRCHLKSLATETTWTRHAILRHKLYVLL